MRTYIDQSRISRNSDRRLHAADLEMSGRYVQLVPAIAQKLAPRAVTTDWLREVERLRGIEEEFSVLGKTRDQHRCQRERWWCELWAQHDGLYRVRTMTEEQIEEALLLLDDQARGLPSECFPDARGQLEEHNDAQIVAQVIVMGGHLVLTSNMSFVEAEPLEDWRRRHGNHYGTPPEVPLVHQQADVMYTRWLDHPIGREVLRHGAHSGHSGRKATGRASTRWCRPPSAASKRFSAEATSRSSPSACRRYFDPSSRRPTTR